MVVDGSDDAVDHRRPCHIYKERSSSECNGSCLNAGDIHPELWYNTLGKPRYDIPKYYHPITLLNMMAKLLTSIVAEDMLHLMEKYQLLPPVHFGGRPGHTTTDMLHILVDTVNATWRHNEVGSVLFLYIKGTFLNVVKDQLLHNLRK